MMMVTSNEWKLRYFGNEKNGNKDDSSNKVEKTRINLK